MTSLCAIIPAANLKAANDTLQTQGFGPNNFSVPSYTGAGATHASLHSWNNPAFVAAVTALTGVTVDNSVGDAKTRTQAMIDAKGAKWGANAPTLPTSGMTVANTLYRYGLGELWFCIQAFNRTTFNAPPTTYPALIRQVRIPGTAYPWKQPTDQFDAYKLVNPFTGTGDLCTHLGQKWRVTQADGSGNNVWEPSVFGWTVVP